MSTKATSHFDGLVGERIRTRREQLGLSQTDVGHRLGISCQQFRKYEIGENRISVARMRQIAGVLEAPLSFFLEEAGAPATKTSAALFSTAGQFISLLQQRDLVNAFTRISSSEVRQGLVDLAKAMAAAEPSERADIA